MQMREKTASLEDLLRMSRHTISTLQQKLRDLQGEYERDLEAMQNQLDVFYKAVDDSRDDDDEEDEGDIIISRSSFAKAVGRIRAHESLEGKSSKEEEGADTNEDKDTVHLFDVYLEKAAYADGELVRKVAEPMKTSTNPWQSTYPKSSRINWLCSLDPAAGLLILLYRVRCP